MTDWQTATTTVQDLINILAIVKPFTDGYSHPILGTVRIEAGGGIITATATNRAVAAHARAKATGALPPTHLRTKNVAGMIDALKPFVDADLNVYLDADGDSLVELAVEDGKFEITVGRIRAKVDVHASAHWPDMGAIFAGAPVPEGSLLHGPVTVSLEWCAKLQELQSQNAPVRLSFDGPGRPIRVEMGDWFVALIMPMKAKVADYPTVPFGLPTVEAVAA
jgi:hypothetical protein